MADMRKCGIIGTGNVGAASAYTLAVSGLFSEVLLLDADMHRAEGEAADIAHGAALRRPCRVHAGGYADFADCGLVILAAGTNQRPGETREALLGRNRAILQSILEQLTAVNRDAVLLVVSNPVDVLTGYTLELSGFPAERVIGSGTVLDTARIKCLLGEKLGVEGTSLDLTPVFAYSDCSLLSHSTEEVPEESYAAQLKSTHGAPVTTYVPFRNGLFLSAAASVALSKGCSVIYYGAHHDDAAGNAYPDCSEEFVNAMNRSVEEGTGGALRIEAPFVRWNKAQIVREGLRLHVPYELTWSCYEGGERPCGKCGTCLDRLRAFEANGVSDPAMK